MPKTNTPTVPTSSNPLLNAANRTLQNTEKLAKLASRLQKIEADKMATEAELQAMLGIPTGEQVAVQTPRANAAKAPKTPAAATPASPAPKKVATPKTPAAPAEGGTAVKAKPGPKTGNDVSLGDVMYDVLKSSEEPLAVKDVQEAVLKNNYKTTAKNFDKVIRQTLTQDSRFKAIKGEGNRVTYTLV